MIVMDKTITGAASGESAFPRRRRIHNLRQKDRRVYLTLVDVRIFCACEIGYDPVSFLWRKFEKQLLVQQRKAVCSRRKKLLPPSFFIVEQKRVMLTFPFRFYLFCEVLIMKQKRAVVSVIGKDQVGIIAKVTAVLADNHINVLDISQTILQDFFTMMMLVDVSEQEHLDVLHRQFDQVSQELGLKINIQLEEIFQAMHRV